MASDPAATSPTAAAACSPMIGPRAQANDPSDGAVHCGRALPVARA